MAQSRKSWRKNFADSEVTQRIRPLESNDYLPNPHRGTTTFQRFQGDPLYLDTMWHDSCGPMEFKPAPKKIPANNNYIPYTTLSYCRWIWKDLEPQDGKFKWKIIDNALKAARTRGQTMQFRLQPYTDLPLEGKDNPAVKGCESVVNLPPWLWKAGAKPQGRGQRIQPDCNDPIYIKYYTRIIRAFAKRYDGHPDLESIDLVCGGPWGEGGGNATYKTQQYFNEVYLKAFKKTQLILMLGTKSSYHMGQKVDLGKRGIAWRADCFGDTSFNKKYNHLVPERSQWNHMYGEYAQSVFACNLQDSWKKAPVTFETCYAVAQWYDFVEKGEYLEDIDWIIEQGYKYHMSVFMPKSILFPEATMKKMIQFDKMIGYRFVLRQAQMALDVAKGKKIPIEIYLDNVGCAPIYRDYPCTLRLSQGKTVRYVNFKSKVRDWMPGHFVFKEAFTVPAAFKNGQIDIDIALCDDKNKLRVQFANEGRDKEGWLAIGAVQL
ncbi:MAG: DUF4832 domain-containing protein [Planctomycetes bacterium]|nr:DUF4832 domain-containing protein [Planctomycetota bacterium]